MTPPSGRLAFGPFLLDREAGRVLHGDREIPLAPKPFETLLYLLEHSGRVVPKSELLDALWADTFVTEDVLVQCVVEIRRALGDQARQPRYVQTVPRRGYRFLEEVRAADEPPAASPRPVPSPASMGAAPGPRGRRSLAASAGVLAAVAAVGLWAVSRGEPTGGVAGIDPPALPGALLVTPVVVEGPEGSGSWLRHGLAELMRAELGQRPGVHVVAPHRLARALELAGYDEGREPGPGEAVRLARSLAAEKLVNGSFVRVKDRFVLTAQLIHVPTGMADGRASVKGLYPDDVLDAVDALCVRILEQWDAADVPRTDPVAWRPVRMATRSLDAFRHYSEALVWFARGGRRGAEEAERRLDEAVRLDPGFAYAYLKKAEIQHWRNRYGYGEADPVPAIRAAAGLLADLPEREQRLVGLMQSALVDRDTAQAIELYDDLLVRHRSFAEQVGVPSLMGDLYFREGRWDRLIDLGLAHVESPYLPSPERALLASFLGRAYRQKGEFDRALLYAQRALRLWPTQDGPGFLRRRAERGRIALDAGERERALEDFAAIAGDPETDAISLTDAAWGFYMAGDAQRAATLTERALDMDPGYGNAHHLRGWLSLARGDWEAAARSLYTAFERTRRTLYGEAHLGYPSPESGDLAALYYSGVAYQKLGDAEHARERFREVIRICGAGREMRHASEGGLLAWESAYLRALALARLGEEVPRLPRLQGDDATFFLQSARLLAVTGQAARALEHLREALRLTPGERQHVQDDPNFESLRAEPEFQELAGAGAARLAAR